tara:strand:+ start:125 stop:832 length:708 start_codon:yes stop_codon:yes gene_type:complete
LTGFYFTSEIRSFWISHLAHLGVMLFAGLVIVGLNNNELPNKEKAKFKIHQILTIAVGVIGLIGVINFIPVLASKIAGIEMVRLLKSADLNRVFVTLISITVFEEIIFRRILAQSIKNKLGLRKGVWISALIFSLVHVYSDTGLLGAFLGGAVFAYIYLKTMNIYLSIGAHLFYNLTTYFLTPIFINNFNRLNEYSIIVSVLLIGSCFIFLMYRILRMTDKVIVEKKPADNNTYK